MSSRAPPGFRASPAELDGQKYFPTVPNLWLSPHIDGWPDETRNCHVIVPAGASSRVAHFGHVSFFVKRRHGSLMLLEQTLFASALLGATRPGPRGQTPPSCKCSLCSLKALCNCCKTWSARSLDLQTTLIRSSKL